MNSWNKKMTTNRCGKVTASWLVRWLNVGRKAGCVPLIPSKHHSLHLESPSDCDWLRELDPSPSDLRSGWSSAYERLLTVTSRDPFFPALIDTHSHRCCSVGGTVACMWNYTLVVCAGGFLIPFSLSKCLLTLVLTSPDVAPPPWADPSRLSRNISQSQC